MTKYQRRGIGESLLKKLMSMTEKLTLIGTWAISFYQKHGFKLVSGEEIEPLLKKYWDIPPKQVESSVVLADKKWFRSKHP